jgi:hypothetical protein
MAPIIPYFHRATASDPVDMLRENPAQTCLELAVPVRDLTQMVRAALDEIRARNESAALAAPGVQNSVSESEGR